MKHTTTVDILEALDGYMLYITIIIGMILFRSSTSRVIAAVARRLRRGDAVKLPLGVELAGRAKLVESTEDAERLADAKGEKFQKFGNPDRFQLLFKAQGEHWKKSTKAMVVPGGCLVLVTSEREGIDGDWTTAESLQLVPGATVLQVSNGEFDLVPAE
jgi:hypothetical protein